MSLRARSVAVVAAGLLILALVAPVATAAATYRDCSGRTIEAGADLHRCDLSGAVIIGLDLHAVDLAQSNLQDVNAGCDPDQPSTNLGAARLSKADARRALLCDANLIDADLRGADLAGASLEDAALRSANASSITLDGATAAFAQFQDVRLVGASLRGFYANSATFDGADLRRADATDAFFGGVTFIDADLGSTKLGGVDFSRADLTRANLRRATGLDTVIWSNTTCPDGTNSDTAGGTCLGHLG
ncbi:MAG TPA: pentapeptide repeat-containing protein [Candidatus Acidoferrum sp.]|nr:pentapeptide repeat-containing protein [Candidatus Acidoferrum sp.]